MTLRILNMMMRGDEMVLQVIFRDNMIIIIIII